MRTNTLRESLDRGDVVTSGWMSVGSPYLAEVLSHSGYDAVTIDLQHGMFGIESAIGLLQAVSAGPATPLARCSSLDPAQIGKLLDGGAYGIICPDISTADEAAAFVRTCRYPPVGARSFGPSRGLLYGGADYVAHADRTIMTWAMIESTTAISNLDAILATSGLDGIYVGPNDLALSLEVPPAQVPLQSDVADALASIATAARAAGRYAGIFCADADIAVQMANLGYQLVTPGNDVGIMRGAVAQRLNTIRDHTGGGSTDTAKTGATTTGTTTTGTTTTNGGY